jgi:hypothetical protein
MNRPNVKELYKYMCASRALEVVRTEKIFFPFASSFNDPFDCKISFEQEVDSPEIAEAALRTYRKEGHDWAAIKRFLDKWIRPDGTLTNEKREEVINMAREFQKKNAELGVLALTEDRLSVVMWAHYGQRHKGACIGFKRESSFLADDEKTSPVDYTELYPEARFAEILMADGRLTKKILYTKAIDWAYEKEWRCFIERGDQEADVPGKIAHVILGLEMSAADVEEFRALAKTKSIDV